MFEIRYSDQEVSRLYELAARDGYPTRTTSNEVSVILCPEDITVPHFSGITIDTKIAVVKDYTGNSPYAVALSYNPPGVIVKYEEFEFNGENRIRVMLNNPTGKNLRISAGTMLGVIMRLPSLPRDSIRTLPSPTRLRPSAVGI